MISSALIASLYSQETWEILDQPIEPISFLVTGWFKELKEMCRAFKYLHRQTLWKSTHVLPISSRQRQADPWLTTLCEERQQRRSRSGIRWKTVLRFIVEGMIEEHFGLDILFDPFFLHVPAPSEKIVWCPGLGIKTTEIPNLITALSLAASAEPWSNKYRFAITKNPESSITCFSSKSFPS